MKSKSFNWRMASTIFTVGILFIIPTGVYFYSIIEYTNYLRNLHVRAEAAGAGLAAVGQLNQASRTEAMENIAEELEKILACRSDNNIKGGQADPDTDILEMQLRSQPYDKDTLYSVTMEMINYLHHQLIVRERSNSKLLLFLLLSFAAIAALLGINPYRNHVFLEKSKLQSSFSTRLLELLEKERNHIAYELHDDVAQKLAVISRSFTETEAMDLEKATLYAKYSRELIEKVRFLSSTLKSPDEAVIDMDGSIEKLCADFSIFSSINLRVKKMGLKALQPTHQQAIHIYRIIQEALNNANKHSRAETINLSILYSHPDLTIKIFDDGEGFDMKNLTHKGLGLDSIQYRLELLDAKYEFKSQKGEGTELKFKIRINNENDISCG